MRRLLFTRFVKTNLLCQLQDDAPVSRRVTSPFAAPRSPFGPTVDLPWGSGQGHHSSAGCGLGKVQASDLVNNLDTYMGATAEP
jgi:hypothetical protein